MPTDPQRVRELFLAAIELEPGERPGYLARTCAADAELRSAVERLLRAHTQPDSLLEPPATASAPASRAPEIGARIAGRYELVAVIGEGGMGTVYRANQTEPVKRPVALKLIKSGMDSKTVLARFDAERQALALMDHPHIARVYDGGSTAAGQPYFVMELVTGVPLTEYCDTHKLPVDARLELFVSVCHAVQHAHQKGIIHRDLKPGNVLVTEVDGRPTPKVIDFGVAKATEQKLTDLSIADLGAIVGTPAYMSPEQADPNALDIDTRTDVYALGVMLYELLTGSPPIDSRQFQRGAILEMLRMVREVEPPRPSTKVSTADALPNIAANRDIDPARLARLMQGELDWVVMKALEKDRTRRYDTAVGLARDVQRYLADEVVEARPPSAGYRLRKFVRRHRGQVLAALLLLLCLLGGVIGTSLGLVEARRAEREARAAQGEAETAKALAEQNAQVAGSQATLALNSVQALIVQATEKLQGPGLYEIRQGLLEIALQNVDRVADVYDKAPSNKEATTAAALVALGDIYRQLGQSEKASRHFLKALEIAKERIVIKKGTDASRRNLALVYSNLGATAEELNRDMDAALDYDLEALALFEDIDAHPMLADSPLPRAGIRASLAEAQKLVGVMYYRLGRLDEALPYYKKSYDLARETAEAQPSDPGLQVTLTKSALALASTAFRMGDRAQCETYSAEARTRAQQLLAARPDDLKAKSNLADVLYLAGETHLLAGELAPARAAMLECLKLYEEIAAAEPRNVYHQRNLSKAHYRLGGLDVLENRPDDARARFESALKIRNAGVALSKDNDRRQMEWMLAKAQAGQLDEALAVAERLANRPKVDPELRVELARCHAIASRMLPASEAQRVQALQAKALEFLAAAVKDGYRDRVYLEGEPDLAPLRGRGDFSALLAGLSPQKR